MKQLVQKLGDGSMSVLNVTAPVIGNGSVLIQNHFSLISAGTEGSTVTAARKSLVGKARERPQQVRQVIDTLRQQGPVQTYRAVSKKLDSYSPLGYSAAGIVIDVGDDVAGFKIGDRVACAGLGYASHAEVISVPGNLCVKLDSSANLAHAAYNTLGAIALQGVRQTGLRVGESCVVIGLGLLGHLTAQILKASGVRVAGLDINSKAVSAARNHCIDFGLEMDSPSLVSEIYSFTDGIGADAVIVTAATTSLGPINLAGTILRQKGTVVVVGDIPTGFDRDPDYYRKELTLKMSCSYGPGRYDLNYEEKGIDYPVGYVRWTENRNMQAFQHMIQSGQIDLDYMTTHRFPLEKALAAYDLILNRTEDYLGILLEYEATKKFSRQPIEISNARKQVKIVGAHGIAFIGAGSYAMSHLLPNIAKYSDTRFTGVMTSTGTSSRSVAEKFGFEFCTSSVADILTKQSTNTIFIATRHDTHATYVCDALDAGKNVFVEKPLCLKRSQLEEIVEKWQRAKTLMMVGFNRRFSPLSQAMKSSLGSGKKAIIYRVNAGEIPSNSWIHDPDIGGGRIVGEVCHFVDLMTYLTDSLPVNVHAFAVLDPKSHNDTLSVNISFSDGSIGSICYFSNGPKSLPKEYIEAYAGGTAAILNDFKSLEVFGKGRPSRKKLANQNKGQKAMIGEFLQAARDASDSPIPVVETIAVTKATFAILRSLSTAAAVDV